MLSGSVNDLQAEALFQQFKAKKQVLQGKSKEQVMAKYGSAAKPPDEEVLALAQSENYVEYNAQVRAVRMLNECFVLQDSFTGTFALAKCIAYV